MKRKYAIVDIETTGGLSKRDKITEIGIVISDGEVILDQYSSLVNPQRSIPGNITNITGITNDMVSDAPKFFEIAKDVIEILEGCIFVAHNVRFDYSFIQEEFRQLGFTFTKRQLCTVVMTRQAFPGIKSYSLGNLIKYFNIDVLDRHRALDDALATTDVFHRILEKSETKDATTMMIKMSLKNTKLPPKISIEQLDNLPETCGVYYFLNDDKDIVYVGKSKNIQKRVISHFGKPTKKSEKMMYRVSDISFEETGSELVALLKEAVEIKDLQPEINRAQKKIRFPFSIYKEADKDGYIKLKAGNVTTDKLKDYEFFGSYEKLASAKSKIKMLSSNYGLCQKINQVEKGTGPCFNYSIEKCTGVCVGSEFPQTYNARVLEALLELRNDFDDSFFVIDRGRTSEERSVILVEEGEYKGFGYIDQSDQYRGSEELKEAIDYIEIHPKESETIIKQYIWKHPEVEVINI